MGEEEDYNGNPEYKAYLEKYNKKHKAYKAGDTVNNYFIHNLIVLFFWCPPCGVIGIIYSILSRDKARAGDREGEIYYADKAGSWFYMALLLGFVAIIFVYSFYKRNVM